MFIFNYLQLVELVSMLLLEAESFPTTWLEECLALFCELFFD